MTLLIIDYNNIIVTLKLFFSRASYLKVISRIHKKETHAQVLLKLMWYCTGLFPRNSKTSHNYYEA